MSGEIHDKVENVPYYFGAYRSLGHYLWTANLRHSSCFNPLCVIDGELPPQDDRKENIVKPWLLKDFAEWDFFAFGWWDYTVDKRPGSNGNFIVPMNAKGDFMEAWESCPALFPQIVERCGALLLQGIPLEIYKKGQKRR